MLMASVEYSKKFRTRVSEKVNFSFSKSLGNF